VTDGRWEVRSVYGVDEASGTVFFGGTERSHVGNDVYRVKLDGSGLTRLSGPAGSHGATFSPSFTHYIGTWSDLTTPTQTRLHKADGSEVRVIERNEIAALAQYRLAKPELLQVKTRDGFVMEAMMIKPPDFDPSRKYPVYQQTYAGPQAPQVRNGWGGTNYLYHQFLAQQGLIIWICDNRSASGKGAESTWAAYQRLGETELADIEDGIAWLKQQPWVDGTRIGINGWSYGGFMTSYALTHSKSFAMGIAGGSVTDWHLYDSIYTERYMRMPQNNPDGYARTSVIGAAKDLSGRLLLIHGLMDDNVHAQNTMKLAYELQKAGKPFELMLYPLSRHGVRDPLLVKHMRQTMVDFIMRTLKPEGAAAQATQ
jgi:dipeptidyl-peptidase-4